MKDFDEEKMHKEQAYVDSNWQALREVYRDNFIAVHNQRVIDSDKCAFNLGARIEFLAMEEGAILITRADDPKLRIRKPGEELPCIGTPFPANDPI